MHFRLQQYSTPGMHPPGFLLGGMSSNHSQFCGDGLFLFFLIRIEHYHFSRRGMRMHICRPIRHFTSNFNILSATVRSWLWCQPGVVCMQIRLTYKNIYGLDELPNLKPEQHVFQPNPIYYPLCRMTKRSIYPLSVPSMVSSRPDETFTTRKLVLHLAYNVFNSSCKNRACPSSCHIS